MRLLAASCDGRTLAGERAQFRPAGAGLREPRDVVAKAQNSHGVGLAGPGAGVGVLTAA